MFLPLKCTSMLVLFVGVGCFKPALEQDVRDSAPADVGDAAEVDVDPEVTPIGCNTVALGDRCDDGNACTRDDRCTSLGCEGIPFQCDDGLECTTDECDGAGGCNYPLAEGECLIAGECVAAGSVREGDPCRVCRGGSAWSGNTGNPCDDGDECTVGDTCDGFVCQAGTSEPSDESDWAYLFAEGPFIPLAMTRVGSGDLVVAGAVDIGTVTIPGLSPVATFTRELGETEALIVIVRISVSSRSVLWAASLEGRLGPGPLPQVALYPANDGNGFAVVVSALGGEVEVKGTQGTLERFSSANGFVNLWRFEGDGRVRFPSAWTSQNGSTFLGSVSVGADGVWATGSAQGDVSVPFVNGTQTIESGPGDRGFMVRLARETANLGTADRASAIMGVNPLAAGPAGGGDGYHWVAFAPLAVTVPGSTGAITIDAPGDLLHVTVSGASEVVQFRRLLAFQPTELTLGPLSQGLFPAGYLDGERGHYVVTEFGGAKRFGFGDEMADVTHARRAVAIARFDPQSKLQWVRSIVHAEDGSGRDLLASVSIRDGGLVSLGWLAGRAQVGEQTLDAGSSRRAVSHAWAADGTLIWATTHGQGAGAVRFTAGFVEPNALFAAGTVDGAISLANTSLAPVGNGAFIVELDTASSLTCKR